MRTDKYNLLWQLTRVKNKKEEYLGNKILNVIMFLNKYPSQENKDRVINYLKGVKLAYKNFQDAISTHIEEASEIKVKIKDTDIKIEAANTDDLLFLYKDLFERNRKWLKDNYRNFDLNEFLIKLYKELLKRDVKVNKNFDIYPKEKSIHKFLY